MSVMICVDTASTAAGPTPAPDELVFTSSPPGMAGLRRFTLTALDDTGFLFAMHSVEQPGVRLFVVPPRPYFPEYAPHVDPTSVAPLELDGREAVLLVVVHPGQDGEPPTANLLAPIAVDPASGRALQIVLDTDEWPLRAQLRAS